MLCNTLILHRIAWKSASLRPKLQFRTQLPGSPTQEIEAQSHSCSLGANIHILAFLFSPNSSQILILCSFEADLSQEDAEVGGWGDQLNCWDTSHLQTEDSGTSQWPSQLYHDLLHVASLLHMSLSLPVK